MDALIEIIDRCGLCWSKALDGNLFSAWENKKCLPQATQTALLVFSIKK